MTAVFPDSRQLKMIVCPNCGSSYRISQASLGEGRTVRCARCRTMWFAQPEDVEEAAIAPFEDTTTLTAEKDANAEPDLYDFAVEAVDDEDDEADGAKGGELVPMGSTPLTPAELEAPAPVVVAVMAEPEPQPRPRNRFLKAPPPKVQKPLSARALTWFCVGGSAVLALLIMGRTSVVAMVPETASLFEAVGLGVNLRGMTFRDIKTSETLLNGTPTLMIEGTIDNITGHEVEVPRLRLSVRGDGGRELFVWVAAPAQPKLAPEASMNFRAQLASPPTDGTAVGVRFLTERDSLLTQSK